MHLYHSDVIISWHTYWIFVTFFSHIFFPLCYKRHCPFQIPSYDSNSHCLCVVGEVYCWWQNYNSNTASSLDPSSLRSTAAESNYTSSLGMSTDIVDGSEASGNFDSPANQQGHVEINATLATTMSSQPTTCLVMGIN